MSEDGISRSHLFHPRTWRLQRVRLELLQTQQRAQRILDGDGITVVLEDTVRSDRINSHHLLHLQIRCPTVLPSHSSMNPHIPRSKKTKVGFQLVSGDQGIIYSDEV